MTNKQPVPDAIMQLGLAFWGSKALLSAVELDLFTTLGHEPLTGEALIAKLGLQPRGTTDWLDALVSLGMLNRSGGEYSNTPATGLYLDRAKPTYLGGMLEMANARLYPFWGSLTEGLRTGRPQNEAKTGGDFFAALYQDQARLRQFLHAMTGLSLGIAAALADKFPWDRYHTVIDIGAAEGYVPAELALRHPHLTCGGFDLPAAGPGFDDYVASRSLASRLRFYPGDFFADPLPSAEPPPRTTPRRGENHHKGTQPQGQARTGRLNGKLRSSCTTTATARSAACLTGRTKKPSEPTTPRSACPAATSTK